MSYVITGASGFVGAHLARAILARDPSAKLIGIDRQGAAGAQLSESHALDLLDVKALAGVIEREQPRYVVHLASLSSVGASWQDPIASFTNNTNVFLNVLECVRRHSPKTRILSVGSSEQYGIVREDELPLRETSPMKPVSPYAVARVAQEHLGDVFGRGYGLDIVATRSFNHVGAGQSDQFVVSALAKQFAELAHGKREHLSLGTTTVVRDFLDVRDVVSAYVQLLERGKRGEVYNVCSGRGTSIAGVIELFEALTGLHPKRVVDASRVRPVENMLVIGSADKITSEIGWKPTHTLEDSLRTVFEYWNARV
jgi:GDP-4-dehydro-6-deoxy-D-mannose reductase